MYLRKGGTLYGTDPWCNKNELKPRGVEVLSLELLKLEFDPRGLHDSAKEIEMNRGVRHPRWTILQCTQRQYIVYHPGTLPETAQRRPTAHRHVAFGAARQMVKEP